MRRFLALIAVPLLACLVLAACGGSAKSTASSSSSATSSAGSSPGANTAVTASGAFDKTPKVTIPKAKAGNSLTVRTLIQGSGTTLTKSDALAANFVVYTWDGTTSSKRQSTFGSVPSLIPGKSLPGLEMALTGKKVGSRVLAVIPPAEGFGTSGNPQAGIKGTTTLVFVVDMLSAKSGTAPTVTFPSATPPSALVTKTLVKGKGAKVAKGELVVAQYAGFIWRTKKVFGSSWSSGSPFGQTIGSRVMLSIPPAQGYGSSGASQAGIKGNDTLLFVVDIIDALKQG